MARIPLAYSLIAAAGFVVLLALVAGGWAPLDRADTAISEKARGYGHEHPDLVEVQRVVTDTAQTSVFFGAGLASAVALLLTRRAYAAAGLIAAVFVVVPGLWAILHTTVHRPRPVDGFVDISSNGFPSGHTANSASAALVFVLLVWPHATRNARVLAVAVAVGFALAIGITRVTLLAHWPSDVLGSWLLVLAVVPLVARTLTWLSRDSPLPE